MLTIIAVFRSLKIKDDDHPSAILYAFAVDCLIISPIIATIVYNSLK